jgi:hypothetical protein
MPGIVDDSCIAVCWSRIPTMPVDRCQPGVVDITRHLISAAAPQLGRGRSVRRGRCGRRRARSGGLAFGAGLAALLGSAGTA